MHIEVRVKDTFRYNWDEIGLFRVLKERADMITFSFSDLGSHIILDPLHYIYIYIQVYIDICVYIFLYVYGRLSRLTRYQKLKKYV